MSNTSTPNSTPGVLSHLGASGRYPELTRFDDEADEASDAEALNSQPEENLTEPVEVAAVAAEDATVEPSTLQYTWATSAAQWEAAHAFALARDIMLPGPQSGRLLVAYDPADGSIHAVWAVQLRIDAQPLVTSQDPAHPVQLLHMLHEIEASLLAAAPPDSAGVVYHVSVAPNDPTGDKLSTLLTRCGFVEYPAARTFARGVATAQAQTQVREE